MKNDHGYFITQEFVPPEVYNKFGERSIEHMDERMIITANQLRQRYGPTYINTWSFMTNMNGTRYRGFRPTMLDSDPITNTRFARKSMHYFGEALDLSFQEIEIEEVYGDILKNRRLFPYIHRMEANPTSWIHVDCKDEFYDTIVIVKG